MTLKEIDSGIEEHFNEWLLAHTGRLVEAAACSMIGAKLRRITLDSLEQAHAQQGNNVHALATGVRQGALSAFQLGLVVGMLLGEKA